MRRIRLAVYFRLVIASFFFFFKELKYEVFDKELIFNYHANRSYFHIKYFALSLILEARVLEFRKWSTYRYGLIFIDIAMYRYQYIRQKEILNRIWQGPLYLFFVSPVLSMKRFLSFNIILESPRLSKVSLPGHSQLKRNYRRNAKLWHLYSLNCYVF